MNQTIANGPPPKNVDEVLRAFFKREIPAPWPPAMLSAPPLIPARQSFSFRWYVRLVVAASIALILVGYLTLAAMFPPEAEPGLSLDRTHTIGLKPSATPTHRKSAASQFKDSSNGPVPKARERLHSR